MADRVSPPGGADEREVRAREHQTAASGARGLVWALLRVRLFYKILIANAAIVVLGTVVGTAITRKVLLDGQGGVSATLFVGILALTGMAVTVLVNALILRLALSPLKLLEQTAARVQAGDLDARVPPSAVTDRELERLTGTFNAMLDNLDGYRQRLREVAARALHAEEAERKRIARELHDDTAQTLAALLIRLRLMRGAEDEQHRDRVLEQFRADLAAALERVRRFARGLRPAALDELGLVPALESHVRGIEESIGTSIQVEADPIAELLTPQAELALYRIAQEALSNAVRHAGARHIELRIRRDQDAVSLAVEDDGRGFRLEEVSEAGPAGLGLFGMQERASYVGGWVQIDSAPGRGTRVRAVVPTGEAGGLATHARRSAEGGRLPPLDG